MADAGGEELRHVAFFYRDQADYVSQILGFVSCGLARGEPSLVALPGKQARQVADQLGAEPGDVLCCDMADLGRNPARIIPELHAFIDKHAGRRVRFANESIWPGRSPPEACEATRSEALINLAFSRAPATILCAYDVARLAPSAIADARSTHSAHLADGRPVPDAGQAAWQVPPACDRPLPAPSASAEILDYETDLAPVRRLVERHSRRAGLPPERVADLVLAASEVAANTLCHTRSAGTLEVWHDDAEVVCQTRDRGWITDPLAGRIKRSPDGRGHGLFLVNQVCDLVEVRTGQTGTTVRMHMRLRLA